jgi:nitrite reductase (NADH) small subunit
MSQWINICHMEQLSPDTGVNALVNGLQVAVFYSRTKELFAISNYCPFGKANILSRGLMGDVKGEWMVASPLYKQRYSLLTGQCLDDATVKLPTYSVRVVDNIVQVAIEA